MENETTRLITEWGGNYVTWAICENCGQTMQYHTERTFNYCPYCGKRAIYEQEDTIDEYMVEV